MAPTLVAVVLVATRDGQSAGVGRLRRCRQGRRELFLQLVQPGAKQLQLLAPALPEQQKGDDDRPGHRAEDDSPQGRLPEPGGGHVERALTGVRSGTVADGDAECHQIRRSQCGSNQHDDRPGPPAERAVHGLSQHDQGQQREDEAVREAEQDAGADPAAGLSTDDLRPPTGDQGGEQEVEQYRQDRTDADEHHPADDRLAALLLLRGRGLPLFRRLGLLGLLRLLSRLLRRRLRRASL